MNMSNVPDSARVDYWRQLDVFAPERFNKPITVIGAGAVGSYVVWLLAKLGCRDITVYDHDKIEPHNIPNQIFGPEDAGKFKVDALAERVLAATDIKIKVRREKFERGALRGVVFVLTDSMASRKQIWEGSVRYQLAVDLLIETRMGIDGGIIYAVRPCVPGDVEGYEETFYSDEEAEESACTNRAIAPTVAALAGVAVFGMVSWFAGKTMPNETLFTLTPPGFFNRNFREEEQDGRTSRSAGGGARAGASRTRTGAGGGTRGRIGGRSRSGSEGRRRRGQPR